MIIYETGFFSDRDLYIFDSTRLKDVGLPLHYRPPDQDESWYIISGKYIIKVGDEIFNAKAGDVCSVPGVSHIHLQKWGGSRK